MTNKHIEITPQDFDAMRDRIAELEAEVETLLANLATCRDFIKEIESDELPFQMLTCWPEFQAAKEACK